MKLLVRALEINGVVKLVLCDESGEMLPDQRDVTIDQPLNDTMIVTVSFLVGGNVLIDETAAR